MGELLLLIDTAGADGSLALASVDEEPRVLRTAVLPGRSASERLFSVLREMLTEEGCGLAELRAISVVVGPGSFTGLRVGLAAAKGLAEGLGIPLVGLSRLAVLADAMRGRSVDLREWRLLALLDAGRGEMFAGRFRGGAIEAEWEGLLTAAEAERMSMVWTPVVEETMAGEAMRSAAPALSAASGLRLAAARVRAGTFEDIGELDARYLRRTPAEVAREKSAVAAMHEETP